MLYGSYSLLGALILVLDIVAIANVLGGRASAEIKAIWTLLIIILPVVGMLLYYLVGKNRQNKIAA